MADRDGECVSGMRRLGLGVELQEPRDHALHLILARAAVSTHALLHPGGRVLAALDAGGRGGDHCSASRLTDGERDAGVGPHKRLLECDGVRRVRRDEPQHSVEDRP